MENRKYELIEALLDYFQFNEWKKTFRLVQQTPFSQWDETEVKKAIYALELVGLLEKRAGTHTTNALYRLTTDKAKWWKARLEALVEAYTLPDKMTFRALCVLFVIVKFYKAHGRPPKQSELLYKAEDGTYQGLINEWFELSGAVAEEPHKLGGEPHLRQVSVLLAELGYLVERGTKANPQPYQPTPKGIALFHRVAEMHWVQWKALF